MDDSNEAKFVYFAFEKVSLCSLSRPRTYYVAQAGLQFAAILLLSLLSVMIIGRATVPAGGKYN